MFFLEIVPKKVPRVTPSTLSTPSNCFKEDEAEEATEKKMNSQKIKKKQKKSNKKQKKMEIFLFLIFKNFSLKGAQGDAIYVLSALKVFLKRIKQKRPLKVHPPNGGQGPLILFNIQH